MTADEKRMMRGTKREWCGDENERTSTRSQHAEQLVVMNAAAAVELKRVQTELRITRILNNDLEVKLDRTRNELLQAQTKVYKTSKKHERIMNYINWLDDEYKTEASSSRVVSTKFIRENLSL